MVAVGVTELLPEVDAEQATRHLRQLHLGAEGWLSLVLLGHGARSCFTPTSCLGERAADPAASAAVLQEVVDARWNVYTACAAFREIPRKGRGTRHEVGTLPGVWADLDVKPDTEGYFRTTADLEAFQARLLPPTLEVASGSGGRHLYWLVHPGQRLAPDAGERLLRRWRDYLLAQAGEWQLDHVQDVARILRLAGTVRWPRADEDGIPRRVTLLIDDGPRYHVDNLETESEMAWKEAEALRTTSRAARHAEKTALEQWMSRYGADMITSYKKDITRFNDTEDWARLLETSGWTLHSDCRDGSPRCRYWTRPGKSPADGKSASTDYIDDFNVVHTSMTIFTRDPSLADLFEGISPAGQVTCDKWTYALRRLYNNDETALLADAARNGGRLP